MSYKNIVFVLYARQAHFPAPSPFGAHHVASLDRCIPRAGIGAGRGGGPGSAGTGRRRRAARGAPGGRGAPASTMRWRPAPPSLPAGGQFVLLEGNPAEAVPLTFRLNFPPNYRIPPHFHSVIEPVTVLEGTL